MSKALFTTGVNPLKEGHSFTKYHESTISQGKIEPHQKYPIILVENSHIICNMDNITKVQS